MTALLLFIARFVYVFASAFQQKSVIGNKYLSIPFLCYIRCAAEYASWGLVATSAVNAVGTGGLLWEVFCMGTGATLGVLCGMYLHDLIYKKSPNEPI